MPAEGLGCQTAGERIRVLVQGRVVREWVLERGRSAQLGAVLCRRLGQGLEPQLAAGRWREEGRIWVQG